MTGKWQRGLDIALKIVLFLSAGLLAIIGIGQVALSIYGGRYRNWISLFIPILFALFLLSLLFFLFFKIRNKKGKSKRGVVILIICVILTFILGYGMIRGAAMLTLFSGERDIFYNDKPVTIYASHWQSLTITAYDVYETKNFIWNGPYVGEIGMMYLFP